MWMPSLCTACWEQLKIASMKYARGPLICLLAALAWTAPVVTQNEVGAQDEIDVPTDLPEQDPDVVTVMEHEVVPLVGIYEVTKDVNVRSGPGTEFKRLAGLKEGDRVRAIGKPKDASWMAISKGGETLGFVYSPVLIPVVDGALDEQFFGSYMSEDKQNGVACDYRFRFEGKVKVEGDAFETSDYEIRFRCASQVGAKIFYAHMFLTEAPVKTPKGLHLIGLDVRSIGDGMEEFLATRYLYHPKSGAMSFEGHSLPRYATPPKVQDFETENVKDALKQALEASIDSWTDEAWDVLLKKPEEG